MVEFLEVFVCTTATVFLFLLSKKGLFVFFSIGASMQVYSNIMKKSLLHPQTMVVDYLTPNFEIRRFTP
jgi:hypothetical protein